MNPTRDELGEAHRLLKEQIARHGEKSIRERHFEGIALNTFKSLLSGSPYNRATATEEALIAFHGSVIAEIQADADKHFYHILKNRLRCGDQQVAQSYVGRYYCYRFQSGTKDLIKGSIEIRFNKGENSYTFAHTSYNSASDSAEQEIKHSGPFYVLANRVYFIAIATDQYGPVLRPIIARTAEAPSNVPLPGVVLTESLDGNIPVAARTILYHENLHERMKAVRSDEALEAVVIKELQLPVKNSQVDGGGIQLTATNLMGW